MRSITTIRSKLQAVGEVTRRIIGAPDYERYVAHVHRHHPGERPLSREEFARLRMEEKYSKPGSRCC